MTLGNLLVEYIDPDVVKKTIKKIKTKGYAKKNYKLFHDILTSGKNGMSDEMSPSDVVDGKKPTITKAGAKRFRVKLNHVLGREHGVNIATQIIDGTSSEDLLKIANNLRSEWNIRSYGAIEENLEEELLEAINKANWENLKAQMKKHAGFKAWEFEGDYEELVITYGTNKQALNAYKKQTNSPLDIGGFGSEISTKDAKITVVLTDEAKKALDA